MLTIGDKVFKTKAEATSLYKEILNKKENLNNFLPYNEKELVENLIYNHPESESKIGVGIFGIKVQINPKYPTTRNFVIIRTDGSQTDFSYLKCITKPTKKAMFHQACRAAVRPVIVNFREEFFIKNNGSAICEYTGQTITPLNCHVDHKPDNTFEVIVKKFIEKYNINIDEAELSPTEDNKYGKEFIDKYFEERWITFHNNICDLRVISPIANLSNVKVEFNKNKKTIKNHPLN